MALTKSLTKGVLLKRYFDRRALSSISGAPTFKLGHIQFGYGFLDTTQNPAQVLPIPLTATKNDITNVYIDEHPVYTYDDTSYQIKIRTEIPAGITALPPEGANVNVACILDETGEAVAMLANQLIVVNQDRGYIVTGVIEANIN